VSCTFGTRKATCALLGAVPSGEFDLDDWMFFATAIATSTADMEGALLTVVHDGEKSERPLDDLGHDGSGASNSLKYASGVLLGSDLQVVPHWCETRAARPIATRSSGCGLLGKMLTMEWPHKVENIVRRPLEGLHERRGGGHTLHIDGVVSWSDCSAASYTSFFIVIVVI